MHYYFSSNINEVSNIILGDTSGSVIVMAFSPVDRGPFKQSTARDMIISRYDEAIRVQENHILLKKTYIHIS